MKIAVVSDTHSPRFWKVCPAPVARVLETVDVILHAGDVCRVDTLEELGQFAPVHAVRGNNDGLDVAAWGAPERLALDFENVKFGMIHDSRQRVGRLQRLQRWFPGVDCAIFGHSHIPVNEVDPTTGFRMFNPGSPTDKCRQPHKTMGLLDVRNGHIEKAVIVTVDQE